ERESGVEHLLKKQSERPVKIWMRDRLAHHRQAGLGIWRQIARNLDGVRCNEYSFAILDLSHLHIRRIIEARMEYGKYEAAARSQQRSDGVHERPNVRHVHQGHVAERSIECS